MIKCQKCKDTKGFRSMGYAAEDTKKEKVIKFVVPCPECNVAPTKTPNPKETLFKSIS